MQRTPIGLIQCPDSSLSPPGPSPSPHAALPPRRAPAAPPLPPRGAPVAVPCPRASAARRWPFPSARAIPSARRDILFSPYGDLWHQLRRICVLELFSPRRVRSFRRIREEETSSAPSPTPAPPPPRARRSWRPRRRRSYRSRGTRPQAVAPFVAEREDEEEGGGPRGRVRGGAGTRRGRRRPKRSTRRRRGRRGTARRGGQRP